MLAAIAEINIFEKRRGLLLDQINTSQKCMLRGLCFNQGIAIGISRTLGEGLRTRVSSWGMALCSPKARSGDGDQCWAS